MQDENPALAERQKVLDEKKAASDKLIEDKKELRKQEKKKLKIEDKN